MLKQRVMTALVLLPLVLAAIFAVPEPWFPVLLAAILLAGSWEYRRLAGLSGHVAGFLMMILQAFILAALFMVRESWGPNILPVLAAACLAWLLVFLRLPLFRPEDRCDNRYRFISFCTAIATITSGWFALSWLRMQPSGPWLLLLLLLIVWAADTGAYFAGKNFGRKKLAPSISPGKTWVGLAGGLIAAPVIALAALALMPLDNIELASFGLLSLIAALVAAGGDLVISLHKRISGFKDSSKLLPGHGGILDRLDSLLATAPFFALGLLVMAY